MAVVVVLWVVAGYLVAVPYTFFASGTAVNFALTVFLAPLVALLLFCSYAGMANDAIGARSKDGSMAGSGLFWAIMLVYFFLPAIFNGVSLLFILAGYEEISRGIFWSRYASLIVVPVFFEICGAIVRRIIALSQRAKEQAEGNGAIFPPSSVALSRKDISEKKAKQAS